MRIKYAAVAALSTVVSVALFSSPALADPAAPGHGHGLKNQNQANPPTTKRSLAADDEAGWVQTVRNGITLDSRSTAVTTTPATVTRANTRSDFDGDGRDDIAAASDTGVIVTYSSAAHRDQLRTEMLEGGCGTCFGNSLVSGNFNGDGYDDLVIADLDEIDTNTKGLHAGGIWIFSGGPDGLQIDTVQHINQSTEGVPGSSEALDEFGGTLAAGDINGDGNDDLAIGVPNESLGSAVNTGGVIVLKGSSTGIVTTTGALWLDQNVAGVPGSSESGDGFGWSLAIGKVNKDAYGELLIGTPFENVNDDGDGSGMVTQFWGSAAGVSLTKATSLTGEQITHAVKVTGTYIFDLGFNVSVGDTNKDGYGEVILGVAGAEVNWLGAPGAVVSIVGRTTGLSTTGVKVISQNSTGVAGSAETDDWFGDSIGVGDVTGDGYADVLVGVPGEDIGTTEQAGSLVLLKGSSSGLTGTGSQSLDQSSSLVPGSAETRDYFADSVTLLNTDGQGTLEAVVGTWGEEVAGDTPGYPSGTVTVFPTGSAGLGTGVTTSGRSLVPADEEMAKYGWNLVGRQG
jgi:hypothetical protein